MTVKSSPTGSLPEPVAIIGMSCRVPGAEGPRELWDLLLAGRSVIGPAPPERFVDLDTGGAAAPRAGLLEDLAGFDAAFFGLSRRMAAWADPQQRMLLELAWQALEDAALDVEGLRGRPVSVVTGACMTEYRERMISAGAHDPAAFTGTLNAFLANLISYHFDFTGPSYAVDSACSSGLTAVHLAVQGLRSGDCDIALAAAANVLCHGFYSSNAYRAGVLSPTGASVPFAAARDGYIRGEGGACVVLKRLRDAERDGDPVHAVIRDVAVSHDGRSGGLTSTHAATQTELLRRVARRSGTPLGSLGHFEAHGPGTGGDSVEIQALRRAMAGLRRASGPGGSLWLGSVKSNIGHLEAAAGLVSLVKSALVVRSGVIPPIAGLRGPHPDVAAAAPLVRPALTAVPWETQDRRHSRRAAVNSFGVGGALAHALIESCASEPTAPAPAPRTLQTPLPLAVPVSAASEWSLRELAEALFALLQGPDAPDFPSVVHTLRRARVPLARRRVLIASDAAQLAAGLRALAEGGTSAYLASPDGSAAGLPPCDGAREVPRWLAGERPRWPDVPSVPAPRRVHLVPYPFQRVRCWFEPAGPGAPRGERGLPTYVTSEKG
ncbi:beta-ketoacyl synthase N-terminal-like domain-containing protein [Streptomyces sp. NPDC002644]